MMFERFSGTARQVVVTAQAVARDLGSGRIDGPELLIGLLRVGDEVTERLLAGKVQLADVTDEFRQAYRRGGITAADAAALSAVGVDVDAVIRNIEESLGEAALEVPARRRRNHIPFSAEAKQTLQQCLREAIRRKSKQIGAEHLLLALLARKSAAAEALTTRGVSYDSVDALLRKAA